MTKESTKAALACCLIGLCFGLIFELPVLAGFFGVVGALLAWSYFAASDATGDGSNAVFKLLGVAFSWDDICAHIIIIGRSGCGKTLGALKSILIQMAKNDQKWGAIVLDEKGDFHQLLTGVWTALGKEERLTVLRVPLPAEAALMDSPPIRINLIGDRSVPWETYAQLVIDVAVSQGQKTDNAFFKTQGRAVITKVFEALVLAGHPVTLEAAHTFVSDPALHRLIVDTIKRNVAPTNKARSVVDYWESLDEKSAGQKDGVLSTAENYLLPYAAENVAHVFSSQDPNFDLREVDNCRIIVPSIPQLYLTSRSYIHAFLKLWFFFDTFRRYDLPNSRFAIAQLPKRGLIIDEAQNSLLGSEEGLADHKAIDKVRGAGAFLIYAMQSYSSAKPNLQDQSKVDTIFANIGTHIIHAIKDAHGRETASKQFVTFDKKKVSRSFNHHGDLTMSETTEEKPTRKPDFFLNLRKFEAIITHVEGRTAHGTIEPLTDDGRAIEKWFRSSRVARDFE